MVEVSKYVVHKDDIQSKAVLKPSTQYQRKQVGTDMKKEHQIVTEQHHMTAT